MLYIRLWRTYSSYVITALYPLTSISLPPHIFPLGSAFMYLAFLDSSYKWGEVAQVVKNLPALQEIWVWSLVREDTLGKEMVSDSSIFVWRIP